ncbi:hypothetical protein N234_37490 [Ralstonia pickettii DTP0602]|nr:hypothetical protein N234_37490 [Ralstonia pickettii DTP0602]
MRHREGLEHHAALLRACLEFMEQARLAHARLAHHADDLPLPCAGQFERFAQAL